MKRLLSLLALALVAAPSVMAFEPQVQAAIDGLKRGKALNLITVAGLMRDAELWCYDQVDGTCAWSEVYLDIHDEGTTFELRNNWDSEINYAFTDEAVFEGDHKACQSGYDWLPNLRASQRSDDTIILGRELDDFRRMMADQRTDIGSYSDCFDYLFVSAEADRDVVTLLQRQYAGGTHLPERDVEVELYFDAGDAAGLTLRE